jgi:hypothetical protein
MPLFGIDPAKTIGQDVQDGNKKKQQQQRKRRKRDEKIDEFSEG